MNKVALITGGGSGIGRAAALKFAANGVSVVVSDINEKGGEETVGQIISAGGTSRFVLCDVSKADQVKAMVDTTVESYGRIDYGFNNAAVLPEMPMVTIADADIEKWRRAIDINLFGVFLCMKFELIQMQKQGFGAIVNTSSKNGFNGTPTASSYAASKHGVIGLTRSVALEYAAAGIRINAVCPGATKTPMIDTLIGGDKEREQGYLNYEPMGRLGAPEEVAEAVFWLCSDKASFVTGSAMAVDGGLCAL